MLVAFPGHTHLLLTITNDNFINGLIWKTIGELILTQRLLRILSLSINLFESVLFWTTKTLKLYVMPFNGTL